ncbi:MAG: efflux RND transporter periplasmic adaptor subunit [Pseudomonadota bacterium]
MHRQSGSWRYWISATLIAAGGLATAVTLIIAKPDPSPTPPAKPTPPLVRFVPAAPETMSISVVTQGTVQPETELTLTSQVSGRVESVNPNFVAGGFFAAGETLVQLERSDYELAIARAESQVASAERSLAEEEGRALQARREWRELGSTKANALFLREPQIVAAKASLKAARAELETAELNLRRTSISLPFPGRIVEKSVDLGQFVTTGAAIARAYGTERAQVRLPITDRQLALLDLPLYSLETGEGERSPRVTLRATLGGESVEWLAQISRTDPVIDEQSRSIYAVATVEQPFASRQAPLLPGLFVEAEIEGKPLALIARLPRSALRTDDHVLLVDGESRVFDRSVTTVYSDGVSVWLRGLESGERVVVDEDALLVGGMTVTPQPANQFAHGVP